jgi:formamidopyrimidine-DNA glycosylase
MPELPDLVHVAEELQRSVLKQPIVRVRVGDPVVLRLMVAQPLADALCGSCIRAVERRGHFLRFALEGDLVLVVNAMLVGRFVLGPTTTARLGKNAIVTLAFQDGQELRYEDDMRMGKIYLARATQEDEIPGYRDLGVDLLSEAFDLTLFQTLIAGRRDQVRQFLLDKSKLASIGNAYADEILFAAHIHPKTFCNRLGPESIDVLFRAIRQTLDHAIAQIRQRGEPIETKVRDFLSVRGKARQPCPACGTSIRRVRVGRADAYFCPTCQPTDRKLFVDFRRLPVAENPPVAALRRKPKP